MKILLKIIIYPIKLRYAALWIKYKYSKSIYNKFTETRGSYGSDIELQWCLSFGSDDKSTRFNLIMEMEFQT